MENKNNMTPEEINEIDLVSKTITKIGGLFKKFQGATDFDSQADHLAEIQIVLGNLFTAGVEAGKRERVYTESHMQMAYSEGHSAGYIEACGLYDDSDMGKPVLFKDLLLKLPKPIEESKWIPVEERLPEDSDPVRVYAPECNIIGQDLVGCYFNGTKTWTVYDFFDSKLNERVTHWQLPSPPNHGKEKE